MQLTDSTLQEHALEVHLDSTISEQHDLMDKVQAQVVRLPEMETIHPENSCHSRWQATVGRRRFLIDMEEKEEEIVQIGYVPVWRRPGYAAIAKVDI